MLGVRQFRERLGGGMQAKLRPRLSCMHDEMPRLVAVGEDPQIGIARGNEIRIAGRRQ
jgi:hypothetical protein